MIYLTTETTDSTLAFFDKHLYSCRPIRGFSINFDSTMGSRPWLHAAAAFAASLALQDIIINGL